MPRFLAPLNARAILLKVRPKAIAEFRGSAPVLLHGCGRSASALVAPRKHGEGPSVAGLEAASLGNVEQFSKDHILHSSLIVG